MFSGITSDGYASAHDLYHSPVIDGPVQGCEECAEAVRGDDDDE